MFSVPFEVSASILLFTFPLHHLATHHLLPSLHHHLFPAISYRPNAAYFSILLGLLLTLFSTPFCITAFLAASPTASSICTITRATLWLGELPVLGLAAPFYLYHHLYSIFTLSFLLGARVPLWPAVNALFAGLALEVVGDSVYILRALGVRRSRWWWLERVDAWQYVLLRGGSVVFTGCWMMGWEAEWWRKLGCWVALGGYGAFTAWCAAKRGRAVGWVSGGRRRDKV